MCGRKYLALIFAIALCCAPSLALSEPLPSSPSISLSVAAYDAIMEALQSGKDQLATSLQETALLSTQLEKSNEIMTQQSSQLDLSSQTIKTLSRNSTLQWILCGALTVALTAEATADVIRAAKGR